MIIRKPTSLILRQEDDYYEYEEYKREQSIKINLEKSKKGMAYMKSKIPLDNFMNNKFMLNPLNHRSFRGMQIESGSGLNKTN